jgi:hypothetical protein
MTESKKETKERVAKITVARFVTRISNETKRVTLDVDFERIPSSVFDKGGFSKHRLSTKTCIMHAPAASAMIPDQARLAPIHSAYAGIQGIVYFVCLDVLDNPGDLVKPYTSFANIKKHMIRCQDNAQQMVKEAERLGLGLLWKTGFLS